MSLIDKIEDIISEHSKNPSILANKLNELKPEFEADVSLGGVLEGVPFGDDRLKKTIEDFFKSSKPLDTAYISSIDFSESTVGYDVYENDGMDNELIVKSCEELKQNGIDFEKSLVEPLFITDWVKNGFNMVGRFDYPVVEAQEIVSSGSFKELVDPSAITMISMLRPNLETEIPETKTTSELKDYFASNPSKFISAIEEINNLKGPTLSEYLNMIGDTTLEPSVIKSLGADPDNIGFPALKADYDDLMSDFSETNKGRVWKAFLKLRNLFREKPQDEGEKKAEKLVKELYKDEAPTPSEFSEILIQSGDIIGHEKFVHPKHKEVYRKMKEAGVIHPQDVDIEHSVPRSTVMIIMAGKPVEEKVKTLEEYHGKVKPGDFMKIAEYAFSETPKSSVEVIASNLSKNSKGVKFDLENKNNDRYSDRIEISKGMRADINQNHKEG